MIRVYRVFKGLGDLVIRVYRVFKGLGDLVRRVYRVFKGLGDLVSRVYRGLGDRVFFTGVEAFGKFTFKLSIRILEC